MFSPVDYLKHILDETEFIITHTSAVSFKNLEQDVVLQRALFRSLEVIGEATKNLDFSFRAKYPYIEWRAIAATRDKLIHHYFDVDLQVVYDTCKTDIPELDFNIKTILLLEENKTDNTDVN